MTTMSLAAVIVVTVVFTLSWYVKDIVAPYHFSITADGLLYVYVGSVTLENNESLRPAVAVPGSIQEGAESYLSEASLTHIEGQIAIYNEGFPYVFVELPKDGDGYTLFPLCDSSGNIVWIDPDDHSLGWQTTRKVIAADGMGNPTDWSRVTDYEPLVIDGQIQWKGTFQVDGEWPYYGQEYWNCKEVPAPGAKGAIVNFSLVYKASDDPDLEDYYSNEMFTVSRLYFTTTPERLRPDEPLTESNSKPFRTLSDDKTMGSFIIYGSEIVYFHAEISLRYPDELIDPRLRGKTVYIALNLSVEVSVIE